jgi:hypothetical protein
MKKQLAITDLTRLQRGCVCVAGYDKDGHCLRPKLPPPGIREASLFSNGQPIIFPFEVVEYDLDSPQPQPPHTEDCPYDPNSVKFIRWVKDDHHERLLALSLFDSVQAIFEQTIYDDWGFYVMDGCGPRSIGTVLPADLGQVRYEKDVRGKWDYRLNFTDGQGKSYRLKITDLTWHYYCDSQRDENHNSAQIAVELSRLLTSRKVYLRVGLARHWPEYPERCYLQVNAIHTFPDYLGGKTFADLRPGSGHSR